MAEKRVARTELFRDQYGLLRTRFIDIDTGRQITRENLDKYQIVTASGTPYGYNFGQNFNKNKEEREKRKKKLTGNDAQAEGPAGTRAPGSETTPPADPNSTLGRFGTKVENTVRGWLGKPPVSQTTQETATTGGTPSNPVTSTLTEDSSVEAEAAPQALNVPQNMSNTEFGFGPTNSLTGFAPKATPSIIDKIRESAEALGIDPVDLATAISYETGGTMNPVEEGPTTQWGQHKGLIQFGEVQAKKYGVDWNDPINSQLGPDGAVVNYLKDAGVQPGMGFAEIYSAINAGQVGKYDVTDENNGGMPGTVMDKINSKEMAAHRAKAEKMMTSVTQDYNSAASVTQQDLQALREYNNVNPQIVQTEQNQNFATTYQYGDLPNISNPNTASTDLGFYKSIDPVSVSTTRTAPDSNYAIDGPGFLDPGDVSGFQPNTIAQEDALGANEGKINEYATGTDNGNLADYGPNADNDYSTGLTGEAPSVDPSSPSYSRAGEGGGSSGMASPSSTGMNAPTSSLNSYNYNPSKSTNTGGPSGPAGGGSSGGGTGFAAPSTPSAPNSSGSPDDRDSPSSTTSTGGTTTNKNGFGFATDSSGFTSGWGGWTGRV